MSFTDGLTIAREPAWIAFLVLSLSSAVLYALVYLSPVFMVRLHSVPWAFHLRRNVDLRYQGVLYAAFHTTWWARLTHVSLVPDQVAWFVLLWALPPAFVVVAVLALAVQGALAGSRGFAVLLGGSWVVVAAVAWAVRAWLGEPAAMALAWVVLVAGAVLRMTGHATEPIPPGLVSSDDLFVPMSKARATAGVVLGPFVGTVSEFAAGLPFRLFVVQVFWLASRIGLGGGRAGTWREFVDDARKVHAGGWRASTATAWMAAK